MKRAGNVYSPLTTALTLAVREFTARVPWVN
jgi:hypothetical protein